MIARKNSWIKRMIAAWMAAGMVISTTLPSLAEGMTVEYGSQEIVDGALTGADLSAEDAQTGDQENTGDSGEENILENSTEAPEAQPQPDGTDAASPEDQTERSGAAETEQQTERVEDAPQEVQLSLRLLAAGEDLDNQTPSLLLAEAAGMSDKLNVDASTKTIEVHDGEGLILLSHVSPVEYYKEYTIKLITTTGWDVTQSVSIKGASYSFLGLGDESHPYEGTLTLDAATAARQYSISTIKALFNALSTKAVLDNLPFSISKNAQATDKPLLAEKIMKAEGDSDSVLSCSIVLRKLNAESISEAQIGGLVDTIKNGASVNISFENQFTKPLKVSGKNHIGLFCNTLGSGASLTAEFTNASGAVSVEATGTAGDAGGFVGHMNENASLIIGGDSVAEVTSNAGNAGGLVGSATDGSIQLKRGENGEGAFTFAESLKLSAASGKAAGGLVGDCTITKTKDGTSASNYDLSEIQFKNITISSGQNVGGLFGVLTNNSTSGTAVSVVGNSDYTINTAVSNEVTNFGGLIGSYTAANMASSLSIKGATNNAINVTSTGGTNVNTSYGGVIGEISSNSYVEIENVSATTADMKNANKASFGGLVGKMNDGLLNVGSVTLKTSEDCDISASADDIEGHGGLVGHLVKGVLRLHGSTDLSGQKITTAYHHVGQIVGNNDNGLVYALGSGSNATEQGTGWSLTRYSDNDRSGSDIGNWGEVVRLGGKLTEGEGGVFTFDENAHTVTVNNGNGSAISDANDFAAYALAFDISGKYTTAENTVLKFQSTVNAANWQNVSLTNDIDLTGTGIIGIGKDDNSGQKFTGTFVGNDHTVTLDIGTTYGANISEPNNAAGQLYSKRSDQRDAHYGLALITFTDGATIQNVTIKGNVNGKIPEGVSQSESDNDIRYPAFVSALVGSASGDTTFRNVTVNATVSVDEETKAKKLHVWQSGFLGRYEGTKLSFENCTWGSDASLTDNRDTDNHRIGGLAAEIMGGCTVTVKDCILSGSITSKATSNAYVGGLIAVSRGEVQSDANNNFKSAPGTITISNLLVNGENIAVNASETSGGLLGYKWRDTEVKFGPEDNAEDNGVTVSGASLNAGTAQFGGLVYLATGYWDATAKNSIVFEAGETGNSFTGKSEKDTPSGLLIGTGLIKETVREGADDVETVPSALYLEVGTYGTAEDAAYKIVENAVTLDIKNSEYFDELVGVTKYDDAKDRNAVVSIAVRDENGNAIAFDNTQNDTYINQTGTNYKNDKTRYYYNLDAYRKNTDTGFTSVTTAKSLVLWSVSQYAANTIKSYFWEKANPTGPNTDNAPTNVTISGNIDLTGYSYYPVTPLGTVTLGDGTDTTLTFDNENIEVMEKKNPNKQPSDSEHQHYLMHHGLLYNTGYSVNVNNVSFSGTVGKQQIKDSKGNSTNQYNSGALIFGTMAGDPTKDPIELSLNHVTLAGIRVTGVNANVEYTPLLINTIEKVVKLTVDTLSTGEGYTADGTTCYAGTSLIGNVGSKEATKLTLSFANIALDGRIEKTAAFESEVYNNGEVPVEYYTTHTIFTRATLLEKFQYVPGEGSGAYNFNSTDNKVTYGVELMNTGTIGRNPDKQYEYYDRGYICDEKDKESTEDYVESRYSEANFIRYVRQQENKDENLFELDINQRANGLLEGCGTYGDPYLITNGEQLISLAKYFREPATINDFQVVFNSKVFEEGKQTSASYHNKDAATTENTGSDTIYTWENGKWSTKENNEEQEDVFTDTATKYLLNAYYEITKDIKISSDGFIGLGTIEKPFSGVIVGQNQNTVKISCEATSVVSFGGLITYSRGSVVKNLTLDYSDAAISMSSSTYPGKDNNYPFFGGVVGYCMGGDTVIDHVSVKYKNNVGFSGAYAYLISAGGYVGLVGGATNKDIGYEKNGGGVVFRNMGGTENNFSAVCREASVQNKTVQDDGTATEGGGYFYRNPYVGRVLDGYVCSEQVELNNTDKNYQIPMLTVENGDLTVSGDFNITVNSAQGLWLLSAIVNSGAGAMDSNGQYTDVNNEMVDAYQYGKPRTASYEEIGTAAGSDVASKLVDEVYWGGIASASGSDLAKNRVSYLVKNYTTDTTAAWITGKSSLADTNNPVNLTFSNNIDMTNYGNGFRGIGSSYGNNIGVWQGSYAIPKVYRHNLLIQSINKESNDTTITLNMNQNDYYEEYLNGFWKNQGAGLFVDFHFTDGCIVNHLKISGAVKVGIFDTSGGLTYLEKSTYPYTKPDGKNETREEDVGVGGFAARTANSWGKVTFANFHLEKLSVYGGTSTGGAIGYADFPGGSTNTNNNMITFGLNGENNQYQPWSINDVKVREWVNTNGSSGGLIGWYETGRTLTVNGYGNDTNQNVTNLTVTTISKTNSNTVATAGGLVGANDFGSVTIDGVNATSVNIFGQNLRDLGGLIAGGRSGGSIKITNCILDTISVSSSENERSGQGGVGGVVGGLEKPLTISGVTIKGVSTISGLECVGGFVGRSTYDITIENCVEESTNISAIKNHAGGFVGILPNTLTIKNCIENNVNILAAKDAGGIIGSVTGGNGTTASNMEFSHVMVVSQNKDSCAGVLVGYANDKTVNGYNILVSDSKAGYSIDKSLKAADLGEANIQQTSTNGLWIGETTNGGTVSLVAVSAKGDVYPQGDVGTKSGGTVKIVYADKTADNTYKPTDSKKDNPYTSANPWLDVNPKSTVSLADGTVMTGNAVGTGVAEKILNELSDSTERPVDYYWNLSEETKEEVMKLLSPTNDAYLTTYQAEEKATTAVGSGIDFPVLVVNNTAEVDTVLWDYIAAMTNVKDANTAKNQVKGQVQATTYKWDGENKNFTAQRTSSLTVNARNNKISITPNAYDNQSSQFTLLKVSYANPTDTEAFDFYLYIPVLVKKVLYISFKTRFLSGTDYCASDYPMDDTGKSHYATAGFDEPLTAYMEYSYEKDTDWQSMLDNGENLLWYYDKVLDLAKDSSKPESGNLLLPEGTQLTLVDRQTQQYYTYTINGNEDFHSFNLSVMTAPDGTTEFVPVDICDLLDLTVSGPVADGDIKDGVTYYVEETNPAKATVRVGNICYRKAQDTDKSNRYTITVADSTTKEARSESYYLTIRIPTTDGYSIVNNRLNYGAISRKEGTLPASITSDSNTSGSSYVVYNGVEQNFTISTKRIHNGSTMDDMVMENGDSIKITLQSTLKLTEAGNGRFNTLGPSEFYHQFDISLKKYLNGVEEYDILGTENITYQYTVSGTGLNETKTGTITNAAADETLTIQDGSSQLKKALEAAVSDSTAVTITAEITLTYAQVDRFPTRSAPDSNNGISAIATSRIANTSSQLPIVSGGNKKTTEHNNRYYTENPSKAILTYSAVDGTGIGDTTQQLGINPSDEVNASGAIDTRADYDYSGVDADSLDRAKSIRYTMQLFQKSEDGTYKETEPLEISNYLQNISQNVTREASGGTSYEWEESFTADDMKHQFTRIQFTPLTGDAFENSGYMYANYRVRLTAVLLDDSGKEIDRTKATDYIIYTNARIYQEILQEFQNTTAGEE